MEIHFKMDGPLLKEAMPIFLIASILDNTQGLFDKTYLTLSGKKRITKKERNNFQLRTTEISHGSIDTVLDFFVIGSQLVLPLYADLGPEGIWEYTKNTFEFLKLILAANSNGEQLQYHFTGNDNSILEVQIGDKTTTYNAPVYYIGQSALPTYQKLTEPIDEGVEYLDLRTSGQSNILLTTVEKNIFHIKSTVSEKPEELDCEIYDFNKFENRGKLTIFDGQRIPSRNYNFSVIGDQDIKIFIEAMLKNHITISCLIETAKDPFEGEIIKSLQIISIK